MSEDTEQRTRIKFCFKLGKSAKTFEMLSTAYGEQTMSRARVFERTSIESDQRSGRPSTSRNEDVGIVHHEYVPRGQTVNQLYTILKF